MFLSKHPQINIELQLRDRVIDLIEAGIDMAVRVASLPDSTMVAHGVGFGRFKNQHVQAEINAANPKRVLELFEGERTRASIMNPSY